MTRVFCLALIHILFFCLLFSPAMAEDKTNLQEEFVTMELTKEYMMEHCGLTEADFEGIDFDEFVAFFSLTPETLEKYNGASLLALYRKEKARGEMTDYTVIYQEASGTLPEEDVARISVLIWELHDGNRNQWMAVDLEKMAVYGGEGYALDQCYDSDRITELTEEDAAAVRKAVEEAGITGWQNTYEGTSEGTTGNFAWSIGIRLDTGECFQYSGNGVMNSGTPKSMKPFCRTLWERFVPSKGN